MPEDLPPITGDAPRLVQVFVNLLANANKFGPEGSVIRVGAVESRRFNRGLGGGRRPRHGATTTHGSIFERFYRAADQEPEPRGLGLGLWIVKSIVERHGGRSHGGPDRRGRTRFSLTLPVGRQVAMKLLVVDDDADLLALVGFALTQAGFTVVKAIDAPSGVRTFTSESPDLAILDINLPGGSGFDVCEAIRKNSRIPIMMLTARGEEEDLVKALDLGADDYLTKPFSPRTLLARVRALLRRAGLEAGGAMTAGSLSLDLEAHSLRRRRCGAREAHEARDAAAADPDGECGPRRRHRAAADARLGASRQWRPAAAEAACAPIAAEDRRRPRRAASTCARSRERDTRCTSSRPHDRSGPHNKIRELSGSPAPAARTIAHSARRAA